MSPSIQHNKPAAGKHSHEDLDLDPLDALEGFADATEPDEELIEEFEHSQRREAGLSDDAPPGHGPDKDDLDLEDLIHEDGARSPLEAGGGLSVDYDLDEHADNLDEELEPPGPAQSKPRKAAREKPGGGP